MLMYGAVETIRSLHNELARHFGGKSKIESGYQKDCIFVNGIYYTEAEFDKLAKIMSEYAALEASRLKRLSDNASKFLTGGAG